jgi:hypothetical protein
MPSNLDPFNLGHDRILKTLEGWSALGVTQMARLAAVIVRGAKPAER